MCWKGCCKLPRAANEINHLQYSNFLSGLLLTQVNTVTHKVIIPPNNTEGTVPSKEAATPLSNCPNSLLLLTKMEFTLDTRPRIWSGTKS